MATRLGIRMKVHMRRDVGITTSSQSHTNVAETLCETLFVLCHFMVDHVDIAPSREVPNSVFFLRRLKMTIYCNTLTQRMKQSTQESVTSDTTTCVYDLCMFVWFP